MSAIKTTQTHQDRLLALAALLDTFEGKGLPAVLDWTSSTSAWRQDNRPAVKGFLASTYDTKTSRLIASRAVVAAWAEALGAEPAEELRDTTLTLSATAEIDGLLVTVYTFLYASGRCDGCGGPKVGDEVYRHFTNTPCGGAA